jgi:hypothetical protein
VSAARMNACGSRKHGFGRISVGTRGHQPNDEEQSKHTASRRERNRARAQAAATRCLSEMVCPRLPVPEPLSSVLVWIGVPTGKVRRAHRPALLGRFVSRMNRHVGTVQTYRSWQSTIRQAQVPRG